MKKIINNTKKNYPLSSKISWWRLPEEVKDVADSVEVIQDAVSELTIDKVALENRDLSDFTNTSLDKFVKNSELPKYNVYRAKIATKLYNWPGYGFYYNWYAATDSKKIENPSGGSLLEEPNLWRVPSASDYETLETYIDDPNPGITLRSKITGTDNDLYGWLAIVGTDNYNFSAVPSGYRSEPGNFGGLKQVNYLWTTDSNPSLNGLYYSIVAGIENAGIGNTSKSTGLSIRLVRQATAEELSLVDGVTSDTGVISQYTGNDGETYTTTKIGTQIWTAQNLRETKFNDLSNIINLTPSHADGSDYILWPTAGSNSQSAYSIYVNIINGNLVTNPLLYDSSIFARFKNIELENTFGLNCTWSIIDGYYKFAKYSYSIWNKTHIKITNSYGYDTLIDEYVEKGLFVKESTEDSSFITFIPFIKPSSGQLVFRDLYNFNEGETSQAYVHLEIIEYPIETTPSYYYDGGVGIELSNL